MLKTWGSGTNNSTALQQMTLTIEVPDSMSDKVSAWEDGRSYELSVTQDSEGMFTLNSGEAESQEEPSEDMGSMQDMAYKAGGK